MAEDFEPDYLPRLLEEDTLELWRKTDAKAKARSSHSEGDDYLFLDFPLWPTLPFNLHVAWQKIAQDVYLRARGLSGNQVLLLPGVCPHSSKLENEIKENNRNISEEDLIQTERAKGYALIRGFQETLSRAGVWAEWEHPYDTSTPEYAESLWWTFNEGMKKSRIVEKDTVVPWCPHCQTPLSTIDYTWEVAEGPYIVAIFTLEDTGEKLLVSTRHPEIFTATSALAVDPERDYSVVAVKGFGNVILQKKAVEEFMAKANIEEWGFVSNIKGQELLGKTYLSPLQPLVENTEWTSKVVVDANVPSEGTGILAIAPGMGTREMKIGERYGLPLISPFNEKGSFRSEKDTPYERLKISHVTRSIFMELSKKNAVFYNDLEVRPTLVCQHCKNEVTFRKSREWFVDLSVIRDTLLDEIEDVDWIPPWSGGAWLFDHFEKMGDYCISKRSTFGISLPIWYCECGKKRIFQSTDEIKKLDGFMEGGGFTPSHMRKLKVTCECGGAMEFCERTAHPVLELGSASWGEFGYPMSKKLFERWWPAHNTVGDLSLGRIWFISQLLTGTATMGQAPFETGIALGPFVEPKDDEVSVESMIREYGSDPLRWYLVSMGPFSKIRFIQPESVRQAYRTLNTFWNLSYYAFKQTRMRNIKEISPKDALKEELADPVDVWFISKWERRKQKIIDGYEENRPWVSLHELEAFIEEDFSKSYLSHVKRRIASDIPHRKKNAIISLLTRTIKEVTIFLNPICPFITDVVHSKFDKKVLTLQTLRFPKADPELINDEVVEDIDFIIDISSVITRKIASGGRKLRWGVTRVIIKPEVENNYDVLEKYQDILSMMCNCQKVQLVRPDEQWDEMDLKVEPNRNAIGKVYRQWASKIAAMLANRPAHIVKKGIEEGDYSLGIEGQKINILPDMVSFTVTLPKGVHKVEFDKGKMYLDFSEDEELMEKGFTAEVRRRIQQMRKEMDLDYADYVDIYLCIDNDTYELMEDHFQELLYRVRGRSLEIVEEPYGEFAIEWSIEERSVIIGLSPIRISQTLEEFINIPTINYERAIALIEAGYESIDELANAEKSDLIKVEGIDRTNARRIRVHFEKQSESEDREICPLCGAVAATEDEVCQRCGTPFSKEEEAPETPPAEKKPVSIRPKEELPPPPAEPEETIAEPEVEEIPPPADSQELSELPPPESVEPEAAAIVEEGKYVCPSCGAKYEEPVEVCMVCDTLMKTPPPPEESTAVTGTLCESCAFNIPEGEKKCPNCGKVIEESEELYPGMTYLVKEPTLDGSMKLFLEGLKEGRKGFCVTRKFPQNLIIKYGVPKDLPMLWLSSVGKENAIRPMDLEKLSLSLEQFLSKEPGSLIMLEGIEFLVTNNSFKTVLKLIQSLKDQVAIRQATLIITVNAATLTASQLNLLEREMDIVVNL